MLFDREHFMKMNATDATQRTSELLERVCYGKEVIVIHYHNQPSVVMLPYEGYVAQDTILLSQEDRNFFLKFLEISPFPNKVLKKAIRQFQEKFA